MARFLCHMTTTINMLILRLIAIIYCVNLLTDAHNHYDEQHIKISINQAARLMRIR